MIYELQRIMMTFWLRYQAGIETMEGPKIDGDCTRCGTAGDILIERHCGDCDVDMTGNFS